MANMFRCTLASGGALILTVTCHPNFAGLTITATDGTTTLTQTCPSASPYVVEFKIPNGGQWTISGIISNVTYSTIVNITDTAELSPIPEGSTVTPTDDILIWLHCAGIWDKDYTTISQVLADASTVTTLIASNNAADYMERSTTWVSAVCADSSAMTKIGANNYCAEKLLGNSTWVNGICNSSYFESVLNTKVPTMTSNTTPSGEVTSSGVYTWNPTQYANFKAFDADASTEWLSQINDNPSDDSYLQYDFESGVIINRIVLAYSTRWGAFNITNIKIQGSNDGVTFVDINSFTPTSLTTEFITANNTYYRYNRVLFTGYNASGTDIGSNQYCVGIKTLQLYGRSAL